jgi:hypothetical protein
MRGGRFLVEALAVHQADRLELIQGQAHPLKLASRYAGGLVNGRHRLPGYDSLFWRSGHS